MKPQEDKEAEEEEKETKMNKNKKKNERKKLRGNGNVTHYISYMETDRKRHGTDGPCSVCRSFW